ncbi:acyl-CoA dehydrogenase [Dietzia sp. HMSC21D01]|uniref:Acyl-CoA dehydrogenase n=1 Tax=Dietzia cinnamea TaxID=321318 RepID=A0AAW5Q5H7_9ACTN|nr:MULTISPECIES: acyl-CoA dehydrogenase [Dietzia]MBM7229275.1 acyl-CoA dehydrogenase [Dietzia cinnamea]PWD96899.1 acyl-CoA dehydrogenase [Dietzia maris]MCT1638875.1 acyl-CoA dehydrogenase [Dietzia cinnamea]MCT1863440.1 acyl-CoA dehydrogenase [Dietzia cinnamea]MCT2030436.1 acyl-CoA dehydrogenase [Dietzia cinnamea]
MDFTRTETQAAVAEAVAGALSTAAPAEELLTALPSRSVDDAGFDERLWSAFATSGLLSLGLPAALGGDDLTPADIAVVLEEVGRAGVVIPALETLGLGVLPIVTLGTADQQKRLLSGIEDGRILTAAVAEPGSPLPLEPTVRLEGGKLTGTATSVRYAAQARHVLVPATTPEGAVLVVVAPDAPGVTLTPTLGSLGVPEYAMRLDGVQVDDDDVLRGSGSESVLEEFRRLVLAACIAHGDGLVAGALDMTADYLKERVQFGKPLGSFQAVQQELADVYIVSQTLHVIAQSVAWRISEGLAGPGDRYETDPTIGAYWLATEGPRAVQLLHHLHGGVGVDVTYPMFKYSSAVKDLARFVGGAQLHLDALGAAIAADPVGQVAPASGDADAADAEGAFIDLTAEQRALQDELREYFSTLISPEEAADIATTRHGDTYAEIITRMGRDGWLGVGWPTEYGGKGFGHIEQQIFTNEATRADVPLPSVTLQTVGPTLQKYGTEKQKEKFLPGILDGTIHFAIGYSEPDAGTDLAALRTTARKDEATGDWIINGQKMWTTGGHHADYIWLAARTGTPDSRHRGLTIFIVDTTDPGFSFTPIITCDGAHHVNATYYSDVRVPADMVVGEVDGGWKMLTTQLNHERVMLAPSGRPGGYYDELAAWARGTGVDGVRHLDRPEVRRGLAEIFAIVRLNELLNWQVSSTGDNPSMGDSAASKVFSTEKIQHVGRIVEELLGRFGDPTDPDTAALQRWFDMMNKRNVVITFGGGVNEVMRELVCMGGLGMPRTAR